MILLGFEPKTHSLEGCCSIQLSYRTKPVRPFTKGQKNAERKGFEPLEVVSLNGFQDRRIRPLCHLSESEFAGQKHSFGVQRYCLVSFYASFCANFSTFSVFSSVCESGFMSSLKASSPAILSGPGKVLRREDQAPTG